MPSLLDAYPTSDWYRDRVYPEEQEQHRRATPLRADQGSLGRMEILGDFEMSEIGAMRAGQSAYNQGLGWYWEVDPVAGPRFSIGNSNLGESKLLWTGSELQIVGNVTATTGEIGGWTVSATQIDGGDTTLDSAGIVQVGTGNDLAKLSSVDGTYRFWVGHDNPASAPFSIEKTGVLKAISGTVGGWTLNTTFLEGTDTTLNSNGNIVLGTGDNIVRLSSSDSTYRLWVGNATAGSAPFRVTQAGAVTAESGTIGGWTINGTDGIQLGSSTSTRGMSTGTWAFFAGASSASVAPFRVRTDGFARFNNIEVIGGSINGQTINAGTVNANALDVTELSAIESNMGTIDAGSIIAGSINVGTLDAGTINFQGNGTLGSGAGYSGTLGDTGGGLSLGSLSVEDVIDVGLGGVIQWESGASFINSSGMVLSSSGTFGDSIMFRVSGINRGGMYGNSSGIFLQGANNGGAFFADYGGGVDIYYQVGGPPQISLNSSSITVAVGETITNSFTSLGDLRVHRQFYPGNQTTRGVEDNGSAIGFDGVGTGGSTGTWTGNAPSGASWVNININGTTYRFAIWADS